MKNFLKYTFFSLLSFLIFIPFAHASIDSLSVKPEKSPIVLGDSVKILLKAEVSSDDNASYTAILYIQDTTNGAWSKKQSYNISRSNALNTSYLWDTEKANSSIGDHGIQLIINTDNTPTSNQAYNSITVTKKTTSTSTTTTNTDPGLTEENITPTTNVDTETQGITIALSKNLNGIGDVVGRIFTFMLDIIACLAVLGIVYGGIMYITSGGDNSKVEKAKKTIIYSIIGILLTGMSYTILIIILKTVSEGKVT